MKYLLLSILLVLSGCDSAKSFISGYRIGSNDELGVICTRQNQILSAKLVDETEEMAFIEIEYFYDNSYGSDATIHVEPTLDIYWPHQTIKMMPGQHKVILKLTHPGMGNSPEVIKVTKAEVMMRVSEFDKVRKSTFSSKLSSQFFEFEKVFKKEKLTRVGKTARKKARAGLTTLSLRSPLLPALDD